ncbi:uncharacterized membrane-anchored protein YitT (DUF2179 family) [Aquamicrobium lusatiense]|uniref:Uncharacterized membrane-anchored protein YitT (DUF2179 family) n=1 Tax=Aquamicrobium lusatiense TaxID=89772 RepID=A0A7W9VUE0_9HYPH|nr:hypothetical protein [Aquamicrobium lusatiense]MBB6010907.1 uncharacterized membrane-anchored protein YitT (DUF2179 family) [Aquamicrobium lusatiense]
MSDLLRVLLRFATVVAGYAAACLAASLFLYVLFLGWSGLAQEQELSTFNAGMVVAVPIFALFIAHLNFWPAAVAIVVGEFLGRRDWLFYAIAGGVVAAAFAGLFYGGAGQADGSEDTAILLAMIGSGLVGGLAYWLVAGMWTPDWRGRNRDRLPPTSPESSGS